MKKLLCLLLAAILFVLPALSEDVDEWFDSNADIHDVWELYENIEPVSMDAITLRIGVLSEEDTNENPMLDAAFFCKYPNATIEYTLFSEDTLRAHLFAGETGVDLLLLGQASIAAYGAQGLLHDFSTSLLNPWPEAWVDFSDAIRTGGALYSFPCSIMQPVADWNPSATDASVLTRPDRIWTLDDLDAMCHTVAAQGTIGYLCPAEGYWRGSGTLRSLFTEYYYAVAQKNGRFETADVERLLNLLTDTMNSGALLYATSSNPQPLNEDGMIDLPLDIHHFGAFYNELYMYTPTSMSCTIPLPVLDRNQPRYVGTYRGYALLQNAPQAEAAMNYLQSAFLPEVLNSYQVNLRTFFGTGIPQWEFFDSSYGATPIFLPGEDGLKRAARTRADYHCTVFYDEAFLAQGSLEEGRAWLEAGEFEHENEASWYLAGREYMFSLCAFLRAHLLVSDGSWDTLSGVRYNLLEKYLAGELTVQGVCDALNNRLEMMEQ